MHIIKTYDLGDIKEVLKYCAGNYGAPGCRRKPKKKATPEEVKRQNRENRVRHMQRLLIANFWGGGWHLVLTYRKDERPEGIEGAKAEARKFLGSMREAYKKAGYAFKYICITETGSRGASHHHLVIEDIATEGLNTARLVGQFWVRGSKHFTPLNQEGEYRQLAEYLVKEEGKEGQRCSYTRSRNLTVPQPKKEKAYGRKWTEEPKGQEGWYVIKDSVRNGTNPATGLPCQRYMIRRLRGEGGSRDGGSEGVRGDILERAGKAGWGGGVARRVHEAWRARNQAGVRASGIGDGGPGNADGAGKRILHAEKAVPCPGKGGMQARAGGLVRRMASAVAGKWMGKREGRAGRERRAVESVPGKGRAARVRGRERKA